MCGRANRHTLPFSYGQDLLVEWDARSRQTTLATVHQNPSSFLSVATTRGRCRAIQEDVGVPGSSGRPLRIILSLRSLSAKRDFSDVDTESGARQCYSRARWGVEALENREGALVPGGHYTVTKFSVKVRAHLTRPRYVDWTGRYPRRWQ